MSKFIILFIVLGIFAGCELQEPPIPPGPCISCPGKDTFKLDPSLNWQVSIHPDSASDFIESGMVISQGKLIYISEFYLPVRPIVCRNIADGKELWRWIDPDGRLAGGGGRNNTGLRENLWVTTEAHNIILMNLESGLLHKKINIGQDNAGSPRSRINGNCLYHTFTSYQNGADEYMVRINLDQLTQWDTVFKATKEDKFEPFLEPPSLWINPQLDSCLVFSLGFYNFSNHQARERFIVYNLKKDELEWTIEDYVDEGQCSTNPILIHENKAYVQGQRSFHCIDLLQRKEIWKRNFYNNGYNLSFSICNAIIAEGMLITKSEQEDIRALDLLTGQTIWENLNTGGASPYNMEYFKGRIYFAGSSKIWGIRASDGHTDWVYSSPNEKINSNAGFISGGIVIDKENEAIISNDSYFIMSIKLPK